MKSFKQHPVFASTWFDATDFYRRRVGLQANRKGLSMKPCLGTTKDEILDAFKAVSREWSGIKITEAAIIGDSLRFRWEGSGKLGVVVGDICLRTANSHEYAELEDAIELGQAQIYHLPLYVSGQRPMKTVLHEATGSPLDENSQAAIRQRARIARAYGSPKPR